MEIKTNICVTLGTRLREFRKKQRLSQEALAEKANLNTTFVGAIERGQANPTLDTMCKLANALDIEVLDLLYSPQTLAAKSFQDERLCSILLEYGERIKELYN